VEGTTSAGLDEEYLRFTAEAWPDPRPFLTRLRETAPVYRTPLGYWFVTDHSSAEAIYRDRDRWSRQPVIRAGPHPLTARPGPTATFFVENLLALDGLDHRRMRGVLNRVFTPAGIAALRDTVAATVDRLLGGVVADGGMDVVQAFARPLPTRVILDIFDVEHEQYPRFQAVAHSVMECFEALGATERAPDLVERSDRALGSCAEFLMRTAEQRRGNGGTDLLSQLVRAQDAEPDRLSDSEFSTLIMHLVAAGFETTASTTANGLFLLLRHRDQLRLLREDPSLGRSAVEEILRYEPGVVVSAPMFALEDHEVRGQQIRRGDQLIISNHGANHDPAVFDDPLRFDITRKPNRHVTFGRGVHACVGAALARLEIELALRAALTWLPELELVTRTPRWRESHVTRGFDALQVEWQVPT
jgi:cytochrome P450